MGNWDFVFSYADEHASWLEEQGLPHPPVRTGNRLPTTAEAKASWGQFDKTQTVLIDDFDWSMGEAVPEGAFKVRGDLVTTLQILVSLSEQCGQLFLYPDTGAPAIVVDPELDPETVATLYSEASELADSWQHFFDRMYAAG